MRVRAHFPACVVDFNIFSFLVKFFVLNSFNYSNYSAALARIQDFLLPLFHGHSFFSEPKWRVGTITKNKSNRIYYIYMLKDLKLQTWKYCQQWHPLHPPSAISMFRKVQYLLNIIIQKKLKLWDITIRLLRNNRVQSACIFCWIKFLQSPTKYWIK